MAVCTVFEAVGIPSDNGVVLETIIGNSKAVYVFRMGLCIRVVTLTL